MERNNSKDWINSLKIAIINDDLKQIEEYSTRKVPDFSSIEEAKDALLWVEKAQEILKTEKNKIRLQMNQLKQTNKYQHNYTSYTNEWKV